MKIVLELNNNWNHNRLGVFHQLVVGRHNKTIVMPSSLPSSLSVGISGCSNKLSADESLRKTIKNLLFGIFLGFAFILTVRVVTQSNSIYRSQIYGEEFDQAITMPTKQKLKQATITTMMTTAVATNETKTAVPIDEVKLRESYSVNTIASSEESSASSHQVATTVDDTTTKT